MENKNDEFNYVRTADMRIKVDHRDIGIPTVAYYENEIFATSPLFPNLIVGDHGTIYNANTKMKIRPNLNRKGYLVINLPNKRERIKNGDQKAIEVHRLMMMVFNPIPNYAEMVVNHIDGNKLNNHLWNLEWLTPHENSLHASRTGLIKHKYSDEFIRALCKELNKGIPYAQAVNNIGRDYDNEMFYLIKGIMYQGYYHYIVKDYPNIHTNPRPPYNLSDEQIHQICQMIINGASVEEMQSVMGFYDRSIGTINAFIGHLRRNDTKQYYHITSQYFPPENVVRVPGYNLTDDQIHLMCQMILQARPVDEIQKAIGITRSREAFHTLLGRLRRNELKIYRHITTQYFHEGVTVPKLTPRISKKK